MIYYKDKEDYLIENLNIYKLEVYIYDFDEVGEKDIKNYLENTKYPNHCMHPKVASMEKRTVFDWDEGHELNKLKTQEQALKNLFSKEQEQIPIKNRRVITISKSIIIDRLIQKYIEEKNITVLDLLRKGFNGFESKSYSQLEFEIIKNPELVKDIVEIVDGDEIVITSAIEGFKIEDV